MPDNAGVNRQRIVLSHTTGHIFDQLGQVTPDDVPAIMPWVALDHGSITVWWKTPDQSGAAYGDRVGYRLGGGDRFPGFLSLGVTL